jgi:hypothetical protein
MRLIVDIPTLLFFGSSTAVHRRKARAIEPLPYCKERNPNDQDKD